MAPSFSRVSSGALLLALAYNAQPVKADFWEDVDNCKLVLDDLPADLTTDFCHDWTYGYEPEDELVTVTGYPVTVTEYPDAKTCEGSGYSTTTKYPESTPEPSKGYQPSKPTSVPDESTKVPDESTKVPDETTKAPDQPPATDVPGGYDVTVTSTTWTTYWTTSTVYPDYPAATPAPYRRHVRDLKERAAWCVDRPCRLVQYDDDTIVEACKKYLGWVPHTSTVNVPGYTITVTSYPTDCKKKDEGYQPDPVPAYPTEKDEGYQPEPYPAETPEPYPTKEDYPTETPDYPEYPTKVPEYEPEPYPTAAPASYPEDQPPYDDGNYDDGSYHDGSYDDVSEDGHYNDGSAPWEDDGTDDYQQSDDKQPWESDFDNNYSGPDGPKPWDDADQTSELADAIDAGGYDQASKELGLDDAPWNSLPVDFPDDGGSWKRDYPTKDSYSEDTYGSDDSYGGEDGVDYKEEPVDDYDIVWVDEHGHPVEDDDSKGYDGTWSGNKYQHDEETSYQPTEDEYSHKDDSDASYPDDYAPNVYGPDVGDDESYGADDSGDSYEPTFYEPTDDSHGHPEDSWGPPKEEYDDGSSWVLPDSSEYEGDEFESDYNPQGGASPYGPSSSGDGVDY